MLVDYWNGKAVSECVSSYKWQVVIATRIYTDVLFLDYTPGDRSEYTVCCILIP